MRHSQSRETLFHRARLDEWLGERRNQALAQVDSVPPDQFLNARTEDVVESVCAELQVAPLVLSSDQATKAGAETFVDGRRYDRVYYDDSVSHPVPGHRITVSVPFTGESQLWTLNPNFDTSCPPEAAIDSADGGASGLLLLEISVAADEDFDSGVHMTRELSSINQHLDAQRSKVEQFNDNLRRDVRAAVNKRRASLLALQNRLDAIPLPLERRPGMPDYRSIPVQRAIKALPRAPEGGFKPEPTIGVDEYKDILSIIRQMGRTFEQTPATFASLNEEKLRDVILAALNVVYKGQATGETFRRKGKTDIRIEAEDRAAFVGECKVWHGSKELSDGIEQMLSYLTWRDCKTALVVFNKKNAEWSRVLTQISSAFTGSTRFKRAMETQSAGEWRYVLSSASDESRDVTCHVLAFNLYDPSGAAVPASGRSGERTARTKRQASSSPGSRVRAKS